MSCWITFQLNMEMCMVQHVCINPDKSSHRLYEVTGSHVLGLVYYCVASQLATCFSHCFHWCNDSTYVVTLTPSTYVAINQSMHECIAFCETLLLANSHYSIIMQLIHSISCTSQFWQLTVLSTSLPVQPFQIIYSYRLQEEIYINTPKYGETQLDKSRSMPIL